MNPQLPASNQIKMRGQSRQARLSTLGPQPSVHLRIEELVLHGFSPRDRHRIGEAVQCELTRLFAARGVPPTLSKGGEIERVDGRAFQLTASAKPEGTGAQVARAVFGGFRR